MMNKFFAVLAMCLLSAGAAAPQNPVKLEGQVVCCAECWAEAEQNKVEYGTAENLLKARSCVEGGDPTLLAVRDGNGFTLYQLATGKFRLPGKNWLEFVGKSVAVTGPVRNKKDTSIIQVDALTVLAPSPAEREAAQVIGREIDLKLQDLSGTEQSLAALKGRVVILNFWATYCIPCRTEMPDLAAIQNEYAALGVQVIGASADELEHRREVLLFVKETKINFPVWMGATTRDMMRFGLGTGLPGTVVIGKDGRIAKVVSGVVNQADLKKQIDALLATVVAATVPNESDMDPRVVVRAKKRSVEVSSVPS